MDWMNAGPPLSSRLKRLVLQNPDQPLARTGEAIELLGLSGCRG